MICDTTKNFTHILIEESWQIKSATKQQEVIKEIKEQKNVRFAWLALISYHLQSLNYIYIVLPL